MEPSSQLRSSRENEVLKGLQLIGEIIDSALQAIYSRSGKRAELNSAVWRTTQLGPKIEEPRLHPNQFTSETLTWVANDSKADRGIRFVHIAHRIDAQRGFGNPRTAREPCRTGIAGFGVNLHFEAFKTRRTKAGRCFAFEIFFGFASVRQSHSRWSF